MESEDKILRVVNTNYRILVFWIVAMALVLCIGIDRILEQIQKLEQPCQQIGATKL